MPRIGQLVFYTRDDSSPFGPGGGLYDFRPHGCIVRSAETVSGHAALPGLPEGLDGTIVAIVVRALGLPLDGGVIAWGPVCGSGGDWGFVRLDASAHGTVYAVWRPDVVPAT
jgi:hypothetical protein